MLEISGKHARLAVVTGGNKGVGLQVCRQLALQGVTVILTARDEERGEVAAESLGRESDLTDIIFHQLDVRDDDSAASLARYIERRYGKLDILVHRSTLLFLLLVNGTTLCLLGIRKVTVQWVMQVNNAAVSGIVADEEGLKALNIDAETWVTH